MTARPIRLLAGFATVGVWTMASRVLGFVRDILIAAFLGSGPVAEAFFVAFRLPNMFRRFFAEGAFNMAFVPMFAKKLEGDGEAGARGFAHQAVSGLFAVLVIFTIVAQIAMPWMIFALASGYDGERFDLAVTFGRIVFPYILFISLAALFSGVLNSFGRFAAAAAAPVLLNVILIFAMAAAWLGGWNIGLVLAWAACLAGLAQLALVWVAARRLGMGVLPARPRWTPEMRRLVSLGVPAALAGGVVQINLLVGTQVASYFDGAVAWLWMADRVYQLPLGVIGIAIGVVLLPELARRLRAGDLDGTRNSMNRAAEFTLILTLPASAGLLVVPVLIVAVLFERGAFTPEDTRATAQALVLYAIGLPAFVLQKVAQPAYFAREDTRTPLRFALWSMLVNLLVAVGLAPFMGYLAAALGTVLAGWLNLFLLLRGMADLDRDLTLDERLRRRLPRISIAVLTMAVFALGLSEAAEIYLYDLRAVSLAVIIVGSIVVYFLAAALLGAFSPSEIAAIVRRRRE